MCLSAASQFVLTAQCMRSSKHEEVLPTSDLDVVQRDVSLHRCHLLSSTCLLRASFSWPWDIEKV